jgi:alanyl-tRNA synthetase
LAQVLGTSPDNLLARASQQMAELKEQSRTVQKLTSLLAQAQLPQTGGQEGQAGPVHYASQSVKGLAGAGLREVADQLLQKGQTDLVLVQSEDQIVVKVSAEGIKKGVSAHKVLQAIARQKGGRGGGKDNLAQGGGFPAEAHELLPSVLEAEISL